MKRRTILSIAALALVGALVPALPTEAAPGPRESLQVPREFPTIQAAVDAAAPGDHITVDAGTYPEEVVIEKDVDVRGTGVGATVIKAPARLTPYGVHLPDGRAVTAVVRVGQHAHVRISGLTVSGPIPCSTEVSGINVIQSATLELSDVRVTAIHADPTSCAAEDAAGRAVVFGLPPHIVADGRHGSTAYGRIEHVVVDGYQHAGISVTGPLDGDISRVSVADDFVIGGAQLPSFQFGIHVSARAIVQVVGNRVVGNVCAAPYCGPDPINQAQGAGILMQSAIAGSKVAGNYLSGNDVGIYQVDSPMCCAISGNTLDYNRYFGIVVQDGDGTANGNTITGGQVGIGVVADFVDTTAGLRGNRVSATTEANVSEIECCGYTATAILR
jgi:parallel beta-helix repeat protein